MPKFISNYKYPYHDQWDKTYNYMEFDISNIDLSFVNSIRRCILSQVNTLGFRTEPYIKSDVKIIINDSPIHNQFLTHRIGMIPIYSQDPLTFEVDNYEFIIKKENSTNDILDITTKDIKIRRLSDNQILSERDTIKLFPPNPITNDFILITKLKPHPNGGDTTKIHLIMKASIGNGEKNSRWSPVSCAAYNFTRNPTEVKTQLEKYIISQRESYISRDLDPPSNQELTKMFNAIIADRYYQINELGEPKQYQFRIESIGAIPPIKILYQSLIIIKEKILNFIANVINQDSDKVDVRENKTNLKGFDFTIKGEDNTLGNILQSHLYLLYVSQLSDDKLLNYVGYERPHPLKKHVVLTLSSKKNPLDLDYLVNTILKPGCQVMVDFCDAMLKDVMNSQEYKMVGKSRTKKVSTKPIKKSMKLSKK